jgi:hypothetical protein
MTSCRDCFRPSREMRSERSRAHLASAQACARATGVGLSPRDLWHRRTRDRLNESKLGTVPSAASAENAATVRGSGLSALKVHCPPDTDAHAGVCFERVTRVDVFDPYIQGSSRLRHGPATAADGPRAGRLSARTGRQEQRNRTNRRSLRGSGSAVARPHGFRQSRRRHLGRRSEGALRPGGGDVPADLPLCRAAVELISAQRLPGHGRLAGGTVELHRWLPCPQDL